MLKITVLSAKNPSSSSDTAKYYKEEERDIEFSSQKFEKQTTNYYKEEDRNVDNKNQKIEKVEEENANPNDKYFGENKEYKLVDYDPSKDKEAIKYSEWGGNFAKSQGFDGKNVDSEDLQKILSGKFGDDSIKIGSNNVRRMGYDLTFSAPKSLSILGLVYKDERLIQAHIDAVKTAMKEFESMIPETRSRDENGDIARERTDNILYAMETHKTSRKEDPSLHTHSLLANMTMKDDKLRGISIDKAYTDNYNIYFGMVYQNSLRTACEKLGYETKNVHKNGMFEIKGISDELLKEFSKRSIEIDKIKQEMGVTNASTTDKIALATRDSKSKTFDGKEKTIDEKWVNQAKEIDPKFDGYSFVANALERSSNPDRVLQSDIEIKDSAIKAVKRSISSMSKYSSKISYMNLLKTSLEHSTDSNINTNDLKNAVEKLISDKELIPTNDRDGKLQDNLFTTKSLINKEQKIHSLVKDFIPKDNFKFNEKHSISTQNQSELNKIDLSYENKSIISKALSSANQLEIITSNNSQRVDSVLETINKISNSSNRNITILSSNSKYQSHYEKQINKYQNELINQNKSINVQTMGKFNYHVNKKDIEKNFKDNLIVIPEAQKLTSSDANNILKITKSSGSKVLFINQNDINDNKSSINVIQSIMEVDKVSNTDLKEDKIVSKAKLNIHQDKEYVNFSSKMYSSMNNTERENTLFITQGKQQKHLLDDKIREDLKDKGELLTNKDIQITKTTRLSKEKSDVAKNYPIGNKLTICETFKDKSKSYINLNIVSHDLSKNLVTGRDDNGNTVTFNPENYNNKDKSLLKENNSKEINHRTFELSKVSDFNIAKGEKINITKGNYSSNPKILKGEHLILGFTNDRVTLKNIDTGKVHSYHNKNLLYTDLEYTYSKSLNDVPSSDNKNIIYTSSATSLNKEISTKLNNIAIKDITLVTEDAKKAESKMKVTSFQKTSISSTIEASKSFNIDNGGKEDLNTNIKNAIKTLSGNYISKDNLDKSLDYAINKLSEKEATFTFQDIFLTSLEHSNDNFKTGIDPKRLEEKLNTFIKVGDLFGSKNEKYTTAYSLKLEKNIVSLSKNGQDSITPIGDTKAVESHFKKLESGEKPMILSEGQKQAVESIITTKDKFIAVQGLAGTGKSTMLQQAKAIKDNLGSDIQFIGLAPTHGAVKELEEKNINSQTTKSLLFNEVNSILNKDELTDQEKKENSNKLYLLDESSMISNKELSDLMTFCDKTGSRAVFLGDTNQMKSLGSGSPIDLLKEKNAIKFIDMNDIKRQKTDQYLNAVTSSVINKDIKQSMSYLSQQDIPNELNHLKSSINESKVSSITSKKYENQEIKNVSLEHYQTLVNASNDYLSRDKEVRDNTLIVLKSHNERAIVHNLIRDNLYKSGELDKNKSITLDRLSSINLDNEKMKLTSSYSKGMIFQTGNDFNEVISIDEKNHSLTIKNSETNEIETVYPRTMNHTFNNLYEKKSSEIAVGDLLTLRRTDNEKDIKVNDSAKIIGINKEDKTFTIEKKDGTQIDIDSKKYSEMVWDYGYTSTVYSSQGATVPYVIYASNSKSRTVSNNEYYTAISRGMFHCSIHTDNVLKLSENIQKSIHTNSKENSLSIIEKVSNKNDIEVHQSFNIKNKNNIQSDKTITNNFKYNSQKSHSINENNRSNSENTAKTIWKYSSPIQGTLGEKYLNSIGVNNINQLNHNNVRFNSGYHNSKTGIDFPPKLVFALRDNSNKIIGVQSINLNKDIDLSNNKSMLSIKDFGDNKGTHINLTPNEFIKNSSISFISENIKTALSIKESFPNEQIISTSGANNIDNLATNSLKDFVVIVTDNTDNTDKDLTNTINKLEEDGKTVTIIQSDESIFKDNLQVNNIESVKDYIINSLENNDDIPQEKTEILNSIIKDIDNNDNKTLTNSEVTYSNNEELNNITNDFYDGFSVDIDNNLSNDDMNAIADYYANEENNPYSSGDINQQIDELPNDFYDGLSIDIDNNLSNDDMNAIADYYSIEQKVIVDNEENITYTANNELKQEVKNEVEHTGLEDKNVNNLQELLEKNILDEKELEINQSKSLNNDMEENIVFDKVDDTIKEDNITEKELSNTSSHEEKTLDTDFEMEL